MDRAGRLSPGCPARAGTSGFGVDGAEFVYSAADCRNNENPVTEVFGFFCPPGWQEAGTAEDDGEAVHTTVPQAPAGSPVSRLGHRANTKTGVALIGEKLRDAIAACPCSLGGQCAVLDELALLAAIEAAAQPARPAWQRVTRGLWHE